MIHDEPSRVSVSRSLAHNGDNSQHARPQRSSSLNKFTSRSAREGHACEFLPTRRPLSRRLGQLHEGELPRDKPGGVEHANCAPTRVSAPTHGRLLVGASHGGAPSSLPRVSSQAREKGSHERAARASGAAGGRKHVGGSAAGPSGQGRALGAGQGPRGRAGQDLSTMCCRTHLAVSARRRRQAAEACWRTPESSAACRQASPTRPWPPPRARQGRPAARAAAAGRAPATPLRRPSGFGSKAGSTRSTRNDTAPPRSARAAAASRSPEPRSCSARRARRR